MASLIATLSLAATAAAANADAWLGAPLRPISVAAAAIPNYTGKYEIAQFGESVALSSDGGTALIGGNRDDEFRGSVWVFVRQGSRWVQQGPKLANPDRKRRGGELTFGKSIALSGDGDTALIGDGSGSAWVFVRTGTTWHQQGPVLTAAGQPGAEDFAAGVALSSDGNTALLNGEQDTFGPTAGAWIFTRSGSNWTQQGPRLIPSDQSPCTNGTGAGAFTINMTAALSADGNTAIFTNQTDDCSRGAVWTFVRSGSTWTQEGTKLTGDSNSLGFGSQAALSADGQHLLAGDIARQGLKYRGWLFMRTGNGWKQDGAPLQPRNAAPGDSQGVALSSDGTFAAISEDGSTTDHIPCGGWIYNRSAAGMVQQGAKITVPPPGVDWPSVEFGWSVALSSDASTLLGGAIGYRGQGGAAYAFRRAGDHFATPGTKLIPNDFGHRRCERGGPPFLPHVHVTRRAVARPGVSEYSYEAGTRSLRLHRFTFTFSVPVIHYHRRSTLREYLPCFQGVGDSWDFEVHGTPAQRRLIRDGATLTITANGHVVYRHSWDVLVP
jgi:hypothetical protein